MKKKTDNWPFCPVVLLMAVTVVMMIATLVYVEAEKADMVAGSYSVTVEHSSVAGDASFTVTLYGPDGGPVLRLEAIHVAGAVEKPGYSYVFTWLHGQPLEVEEVAGDGR